MYIVENGKYSFNDLTVEEKENLIESISNIIRVYHNKLTERVIVPQDMGQGPAIRHRPLYFGFGDDNKSIEEIKKEIVSLHGHKKYLEACKYCNGRDHLAPKIKAAIQTKKPLPIPKY